LRWQEAPENTVPGSTALKEDVVFIYQIEKLPLTMQRSGL